MQRTDSFLVKKSTAKAVEMVACGGSAGAILALLIVVMITGEASTGFMEYVPAIGAVVGGIAAFTAVFVKNFRKKRGIKCTSPN